jgi:hypothetical protein
MHPSTWGGVVEIDPDLVVVLVVLVPTFFSKEDEGVLAWLVFVPLLAHDAEAAPRSTRV